MAKFEFRLATLLRVYEAARDERRERLAEAYEAERVLEDRRGQLEADEQTVQEQRRAMAAGTVDVDRLVEAQRYELALRGERMALEEQRTRLAEETERRREALVAADRQVRVLEKLRAQHKLRHRRAERRLEGKRMDEVAQHHRGEEEDVQMMRHLGKLAPLLAYLCIATMITQLIGVALFMMRGQIDYDRLMRMLAVLHGVDTTVVSAEKASGFDVSQEQTSLEAIDTQRAIHTRHLELREEALKSQLALIRSEKRKLVEGSEHLTRLKRNFKAELEKLEDKARQAGRESEVETIKKVKPKQVKEIIKLRIEDGRLKEVVALLAAIPIAERAKIVNEFRAPEEIAQLNEILLEMKKGGIEADLIQDIQQQVDAFRPEQP